MSDGINGKIGEEAQPLLVIADDSDEPTPALLVVDEPEPAPLPAPAVEAIETKVEIEAVAPALTPDAPAAQPAAPVEAKPVEPTAPANQPVETGPAASAPLPHPGKVAEAATQALEPQAVKRPRRMVHPMIPLAAVSLAVFASSISVIGLLVASRTVAETKIVLEQVQRHQNKMRHLEQLIDDIDALRQREQLALVRLEQINAGKPATGAEVRSAVGSLQLAIAKFQPGGTNGSLTLLRDGQAELAERVGTVYRRVEAMNDKMDKLASAKGRSPEAR